MSGRDDEDLKQECLIALLEALRSYDHRKGDFLSFVNLCMKHRILSLIKSERQHKRRVLNDAVSLFAVQKIGSLLDVTPDNRIEDPADVVAEQDEKDYWCDKLRNKLTRKESIVFRNFLNGKSYLEIAAILKIDRVKPVDNSLTRCRKKACEFMDRYNVRHTVS